MDKKLKEAGKMIAHCGTQTIYWNKGLMTEAARAVIDYLFSKVGVHRIEIAHAVKNPASGKVAQSVSKRQLRDP